MEKHDVFEVGLFLFVLAFAVIVVEERWLRMAVAVVPALLLAQRSLYGPGGGKEEEVPSGASDRRMDKETRTAIDQLLWQVREFYLTCHLMGTGKMTTDEAVEKTAKLEKELNRILASITDGARVRAPNTSTVHTRV